MPDVQALLRLIPKDKSMIVSGLDLSTINFRVILPDGTDIGRVNLHTHRSADGKSVGITVDWTGGSRP